MFLRINHILFHADINENIKRLAFVNNHIAYLGRGFIAQLCNKEG